MMADVQILIDEVRCQIREYIGNNFLFGLEMEELCNDGSFLDNGIIDSTGIMELVIFVESEFGIVIKDIEIVPENLDSINNLSNFIIRKINGIKGGENE